MVELEQESETPLLRDLRPTYRCRDECTKNVVCMLCICLIVRRFICMSVCFYVCLHASHKKGKVEEKLISGRI